MRQAPFNEVITSVAEETGIEIYIFDDTDKKTLTVEFSDRSLESGLRSILKGVNHAIVYQDGLEKGEVSWVKNIYKKSNRELQGSVLDRSTGLNRRRAVSINKKSNPRIYNTTKRPTNTETSTMANNILSNKSENDTPQNSKSNNNSDNMPSWYYEGMSKAEGKLRYRIDMLKRQIENGTAEREYEKLASIRGKDIVPTPEEQLKIYYNKLEKLSGN
ncbi:MAG: hypothetical protein PVG39_25140 [Desulfobacteraceae bacterium]